MDLSELLARFWGCLLVVPALLLLLRNNATLASFMNRAEDRGALFFYGMLIFILGLITVLLHNVWVQDWRVLITVIGWVALIKGAFDMGFPELKQAALSKTTKGNALQLRILLACAIIFGAILLWFSL